MISFAISLKENCLKSLQDICLTNVSEYCNNKEEIYNNELIPDYLRKRLFNIEHLWCCEEEHDAAAHHYQFVKQTVDPIEDTSKIVQISIRVFLSGLFEICANTRDSRTYCKIRNNNLNINTDRYPFESANTKFIKNQSALASLKSCKLFFKSSQMLDRKILNNFLAYYGSYNTQDVLSLKLKKLLNILEQADDSVEDVTAYVKLFLAADSQNFCAKLKSQTEAPALHKRLTNIVHNRKAERYDPHTLHGHHSGITCMTIWDDKLISGSEDRTIKIWDLKTRRELRTLKGHQGGITCMKILDGGQLISGSDDTVKIWDLNTGQELQKSKGPQSCRRILDNSLISALDRTVRIRGSKFISGSDDTVRIRGSKLISALDDTVKIWGNKLIFASSYGITVWDLNTTEQTLETLEGPQSCMTIWGNRLISGSGDRITIWDLDIGQKLMTLIGHRGSIRCMTIWHDKLISGSDDHKIKIWDLDTGRMLQTLRGHDDSIRCMTILGDRLISGSDDFTMKIWDLNTGKELATLRGHRDAIRCVTILGNGLISGSDDRTMKIWDCGRESPRK